MSVVPFKTRSGGTLFSCTAPGCGAIVIAAVHDGEPLCAMCRWFDEQKIAPEVREHVRRVMGVT